MIGIARRLIGVIILAVTVGGTLLAVFINRAEQQRTFTVEFIRGDRPTDTADAVEQQVVALLNTHGDMHARVIGYTVAGGDMNADTQLSLARAQNVAAAIEAHGVPVSRLVVLGDGSANMPTRLAGETDAAWEHRASRVEITVDR